MKKRHPQEKDEEEGKEQKRFKAPKANQLGNEDWLPLSEQHNLQGIHIRNPDRSNRMCNEWIAICPLEK